ncbi:hypothetical protein N9908_05510 [Akkermansiaceae bacterium]|nr:hypothetical protein [Akkermansiaceae bacterium]
MIDRKVAEEGIANADPVNNWVDLDHETFINEDGARILANYEGELGLCGLTEISEAAAECLASHKGDKLHLGDVNQETGLSCLSDGTAKALAKYEGGLILGGIKELSDFAAKCFASSSNLILALPPVRPSVDIRISEEGLDLLAKMESQVVRGDDFGGCALACSSWAAEMRKYKTLNEVNAKTLVAEGVLEKPYEDGGAPEEFYLYHMNYITEEGAKIIANEYIPDEVFEGQVEMNGLKFLSSACAQHLAKLEYGLHLNGLKALSDDSVKAISVHKGEMLVLGLVNPSETQLLFLSERNGELALDGVTSLSDSEAQALAKHKGALWLENLVEISDESIECLSKHIGFINGMEPKDWAKSLRLRS